MLKIEYITRKQVSKFYKKLRSKIKNKMHKIWEENKLGIEPCENGKSYCEITIMKLDGILVFMTEALKTAEFFT